MTIEHVQVNRAPVLRLWAAVVARCLGFDRDEALSMGRVVAGLNAYLKGKSLGLYSPHPNAPPDQRKHPGSGAVVYVELPKRAVAVMQTAQGLRALSKDEPADPESVQRRLESKFAESLPYVEDAGRWQACLLRQVSVRRRSPPRCVQPYLNPVHAL